MVDLSKTENRPVNSSTVEHLNVEVVDELGNGQMNQTDYTGASIRVLEGIEAIRFLACNVHWRYQSAWSTSLGERSCR